MLKTSGLRLDFTLQSVTTAEWLLAEDVNLGQRQRPYCSQHSRQRRQFPLLSVPLRGDKMDTTDAVHRGLHHR